MDNTTGNYTLELDEDSAFRSASVVCGYVLLLVFLCSLSLSCAVLWALWKTDLLQSCVYRLTAFILLDEVLIRIFGSPLIITSMLARRWLYTDVGCTFYAFFMTWQGVTTTSLFSCVAVERYIIMCHPDLRQGLTMRVTNAMALACYIHGLIWAITPLVMVNGYVYEPSRLSCTPDWSRDNASFILGLFSVCFLIPVMVSIYSYIQIYRTVRRHRVTSRFTTSMDRDVAFNTAITLSAFLFAWIPYTCIGFSKTLGFEEGIHIQKRITFIPLVTAKTAGLWHPLIFGFNNKDIRKVIGNKLYQSGQLFNLRRNMETESDHSVEGRKMDKAKSTSDKQVNEVTHKNCAYRPVEDTDMPDSIVIPFKNASD